MKLLPICLTLVACTCPSSNTPLGSTETFEFGINMGHLAFTTSGSIGLMEKIKRISVVIPECTELKYVRVDINYLFNLPSVRFEWESRSVIIQSSPLQISTSQYTVSVKVENVPCSSGNGNQEQSGNAIANQKPSGNANQKPSGNANQKPSGNANQKPSGNANQKPSANANQKPSGNANQKPSGNANQKPSGNANQKPSGNANQKPSGNSNQKPSGNANQKPSGNANQKPSGN